MLPGGSILKAGIDQVKKDLEALPPDKKGAFVSTIDTHGKISMGLATRTQDGWIISAQVGFKLGKTKPDGYVGVSKVW